MDLKVFKVDFSRWRLYLSIGTKMLVAFSLIIAVLAGGFYFYIDKTLISQAEQKAEHGLATKVGGAVGIYNARMGQMKFGMLQAGSMVSMQKAVVSRDGNFLSDTINRFATMRPYVDYWAVVDSAGSSIVTKNGSAPSTATVEGGFGSISRAGYGKAKTDGTSYVEPFVNSIIARVLKTKEVVLSTESVESGIFGHISRQEGALEHIAGSTELMQVVVTPVITEKGGLAGAIMTGILLDDYEWLPESIDKSFAVDSALFDLTGGSAKLVTASPGARRLLTDGSTALRADIAADNRLFAKGGFAGSVVTADGLFFIAVEPLYNLKQRVIGAIAVTVPGTEVFASVVELKGNLTSVVLVSVLFSLLLAWVTYRDIIRPIEALTSAMNATADGETDVRVDIRTKDEFEYIGNGFNTMIKSIGMREQKLNHFVEFVRILIGDSDPDGLISDSLIKIVSMTGSSIGIIYIKDPSTGVMWPAESIGIAEGELETFVCDATFTIKAEASKRSAVYVNQVDEKMLLQAGFTGLVPEGLEYFVICRKGLMSGVFMLGRPEEAYTGEELEHIEHLVTQFAIALDSTYSHKEVERLSITDSLTGLYNRRYFYDRFKLEFDSANRYNYTMAVLMIDIDDFKSINDNYGHHMGDTVLKKISSVLIARTRATDIWARYGGEEFIGFVSHCHSEGTVTLAEKIRSSIEETVFEGLGDRRVTVSIGMGLHPCAELNGYDEIVKVADEQLYIAKNSGKNKVCVSKGIQADAALCNRRSG